MHKGRVLWGAKNIFAVQSCNGTNKVYECRVKGKKVSHIKGEQSFLVPGDKVLFEIVDDKRALIINREPRNTVFSRKGKYKNKEQAVVANIDVIVLMLSIESPPFPAHFADYVLAATELHQLSAIILCNKIDKILDVSKDFMEKLQIYEDIGYPVIRTSTINGEGIAFLKENIKGTCAAIIGQSGVGKTSIIKKLFPEYKGITGELSRKYKRGQHTTTRAELLMKDDISLIDTPGIQSIMLHNIELNMFSQGFRELSHNKLHCRFFNCTHIHEPGCSVRGNREIISEQRYRSYEKLFKELSEEQKKRIN